MKLLFRHALSRTALLLILLPAVMPARAVEIVASIRPLAMLAEAVVVPGDEVGVLLSGGDPHVSALRPSQRMMLQRSELVLWVGPELESSLARLLDPESGRDLRASAVDRLEWPGSAGADPHIWLGPGNMALVAGALAEHLAELNPAAAPAYRKNAQVFSETMVTWQNRISDRLEDYRGHILVSSHEAYGHFFAGTGIELLSLDEGGHGHHGAATLLKLRRQVRSPGCFLGDPTLGSTDERIATQLGLPYVGMDPLGNELAPGSEIAQLYESLLDAVVGCLKESAATR